MGKNLRSSVKLYEDLLMLQNVKEGEKVVIVTEQQYARSHASILNDNQTALANLGADFYTMIIPPKTKNIILDKPGTAFIFDSLKDADFILTLGTYILYGTDGGSELLKSGIRSLNNSLDEGALRRLWPTEKIIDRAFKGARMMENAMTLKITSKSGTNLTVPYVIEEILRGAAEGYDAIIPSCVADPGVSETRAMVEVPVVGPGESALHLACMLGYRVGFLELGGTEMAQLHGTGSNWARQLVRAHGLLDRVISIRSIRLTSRELGNVERSFERIYKTAKASLEEDGAEVLVFGCTAIMGFAEELQQKLNIPVIEPIVAALKMAEILVATNLRHSRLAYPSESEMDVRVEMKCPPTLVDFFG